MVFRTCPVPWKKVVHHSGGRHLAPSVLLSSFRSPAGARVRLDQITILRGREPWKPGTDPSGRGRNWFARYLGNDRNLPYRGFPSIPRQRQRSAQAPIDLLGRSEDLDGFLLAAVGPSADGRACAWSGRPPRRSGARDHPSLQAPLQLLLRAGSGALRPGSCSGAWKWSGCGCSRVRTGG